MAVVDPNIARIVHDPEWLAHRYDPERDLVHFIRVPRAEHDASTFLTDEYLNPKESPQLIPRAEIVAASPIDGPLHFIFHSAFCCSTLLARAFDLPGTAIGLKEPVLLNDIVGWRHRGGGSGPLMAQTLDQMLTLLSRPFGPGESVVIKPSNVINGLAHAMLAMRPQSSALLLYAPLGIYLRSVAKKGIDGRLWVRDLLCKLLREGIVDLGFEGEDYLRLTDLQAAAVGWLSQHGLFARLVNQFPDRIRTLDSETLLTCPEAAMSAIAKLYRLNIDLAKVQEIVSGPAFTSHSKHRGTFDRGARKYEYQAVTAAHGDEIKKVEIWAAAVAANVGLEMTLDQQLLQK